MVQNTKRKFQLYQVSYLTEKVVTDQEIIQDLLMAYLYDEGVTLDSNGTGPRRHLPLSKEMRAEFDKRLQEMERQNLLN